MAAGRAGTWGAAGVTAHPGWPPQTLQSCETASPPWQHTVSPNERMHMLRGGSAHPFRNQRCWKGSQHSKLLTCGTSRAVSVPGTRNDRLATHWSRISHIVHSQVRHWNAVDELWRSIHGGVADDKIARLCCLNPGILRALAHSAPIGVGRQPPRRLQHLTTHESHPTPATETRRRCTGRHDTPCARARQHNTDTAPVRHVSGPSTARCFAALALLPSMRIVDGVVVPKDGQPDADTGVRSTPGPAVGLRRHWRPALAVTALAVAFYFLLDWRWSLLVLAASVLFAVAKAYGGAPATRAASGRAGARGGRYARVMGVRDLPRPPPSAGG